jgi:glycerol kinase
MQMQSDISGIDVLRSENAEATARGAAFLAGLSVGIFRDREHIKQKCMDGVRFSPKMSEDERCTMLRGWHKAVRACRVFSEPDNDIT